MQGYSIVYKWTILKRTSPEVKCLHSTSSKREMCTSSVNTVIYHKFSHGAAFYTLNGKNVNVMLELVFVHNGKSCFCSQWQIMFLFTMANHVFVHNGKSCFCSQWQIMFLFTMANHVFVHNGKSCFCSQWQIMFLFTMANHVFVHNGKSCFCSQWQIMFLFIMATGSLFTGEKLGPVVQN